MPRATAGLPASAGDGHNRTGWRRRARSRESRRGAARRCDRILPGTFDGSAASFEEKDRAGAHNFAAAARAAGVRRIIYLGGLGDSSAVLWTDLRPPCWRYSGCSACRRSIPRVDHHWIGQPSFEMVRALAERLPVMVTPKWVAVKAQPIAIVDMIEYLVAALKVTPGAILFTKSAVWIPCPTATSCASTRVNADCTG